MPSRTIANTASELIPRNTYRKSLIMQNEDPTLNVFIKRERADGLTVTTTDHDHRLGPGGFIALNNGTDGLQNIIERYTIIAESGAPRVSYFETEDVTR